MIGNFAICWRSCTSQERRDYQSLYCGLCKALRHSIGALASFALVNDAVFLSLLLPYRPWCMESVGCLINPTRNVLCLPKQHSLIQASVWMNTVFVLCKYYDDVLDGSKSWIKNTIAHLFLRHYNYLNPMMNISLDYIQETMRLQFQAEQQKKPYEETIAPVCQFSSHLFEHCLADQTDAVLTRSCGRIYAELTALYDAMQDYVQDRQEGKHNFWATLLQEKNNAWDYVHSLIHQFSILGLAICPVEHRSLWKMIYWKNFVPRFCNLRKNYAVRTDDRKSKACYAEFRLHHCNAIR